MSIDSGELQIGRFGFAMAKKKAMRGISYNSAGEANQGETPTYGEN